jgi:uncharacterized protein
MPMPTSLSLPTLAAVAVSLGAAATATAVLARSLDRPPAVIALPATAAVEPPGPRGFTASGTATIEALPDVAELVATLEVERPRPSDAARLVRGHKDRLMAALDAAGVKRADVSLSAVQLGQVLETIDPHRGTTRVRGHRAAISVTIASRDFDAIERLMEVAAEAGASGVHTRFRVDDLPALKKRVRAMAATAARDKAAELTSALGVKLGAVRAIVESPGDGWQWNGTYANAVVREAAAEGPAHGTVQRITMTVEVTYELGG